VQCSVPVHAVFTRSFTVTILPAVVMVFIAEPTDDFILNFSSMSSYTIAGTFVRTNDAVGNNYNSVFLLCFNSPGNQPILV